HLPLAYRRDRHLRRHFPRQLGQQKILKDTAGALHRRRELLIANFQDIIGSPAQGLRIGRLENQLDRKDDPFLVYLENTLAIAKVALLIVKHPDPAVIEEPDTVDALG